MTSVRHAQPGLVSTLFSAACALLPAPAAAFPILASPQPAIEYFNVGPGHYFLAANQNEMAAIEAGSAGPGWVRTGYSFDNFHFNNEVFGDGEIGLSLADIKVELVRR